MNYSVYYRLVNELDMIYLPFAAFTRVRVMDHFSLDQRRSFNDNLAIKRQLLAAQHAQMSNLFEMARYATITHKEEGLTLLREICYKHKIRYRLQYKFKVINNTILG